MKSSSAILIKPNKIACSRVPPMCLEEALLFLEQKSQLPRLKKINRINLVSLLLFPSSFCRKQPLVAPLLVTPPPSSTLEILDLFSQVQDHLQEGVCLAAIFRIVSSGSRPQMRTRKRRARKKRDPYNRRTMLIPQNRRVTTSTQKTG